MNKEMKKILFLLFCLTVHLVAVAVTFDVDGVRYEIISQSDRTVSVAIIPKSLSYPSYSTYTGDYNIPKSVQFNGITFDVIGIGTNAFSECRSLDNSTSYTTPFFSFIASIKLSNSFLETSITTSENI